MVGFWSGTKDLLEVSDREFKIQPLNHVVFSSPGHLHRRSGGEKKKKAGDLRLDKGNTLIEDGL